MADSLMPIKPQGARAIRVPLSEEIPPAISNNLLAALPPLELKAILRKLKPFELVAGEVLYLPDKRIEHVYFPTTGVISLLASLASGETVETGLIGREGVAGINVALGAELSPHQALVQVGGHAMTMPAADFRTIAASSRKLHELLLRYMHALYTQVAQTAACNRLHTVEARLAHWLLLTHDRAPTDEFILTQEFIARMLGVRRAGVNVAANALRRADLINYRRGRVVILDRKRLEAASCECYQTIKDEYDRALTF